MKILFLMIAILGFLRVEAQSGELPDELFQYAKSAKNEIINNCSGCKDKSSFSTSCSANDWSINRITGRFKMKVKYMWDGCLSGYTYYIEGYLSGDLDGCNAKFSRSNKSIVISSDEEIKIGKCLD